MSLTDKHSTRAGHPLNGTKFFTWGSSDWGKFQQDFMAATDYAGNLSDPSHYNPFDGHARYGDYTELQVGPAASQEHVFPVVANSEYQWTEWFAGWMADPAKMQDRDYYVPMQEIAHYLDGDSKPALAPSMIDDIDAFLSNVSNIKPKPGQFSMEES